MNYGLQPRDLDDLTQTELAAFMAHLDAVRHADG